MLGETRNGPTGQTNRRETVAWGEGRGTSVLPPCSSTLEPPFPWAVQLPVRHGNTTGHE